MDAVELGDLQARRNNDDKDMARLGKTPVLKRNFGFMSILGFSCTVLITWEGFLIVFAQGFVNGGPAGVIYGYIFVWIGTLAVFLTLAEATSMAPTSGGQYHWVSMLAPPKYQKFLSYITGWLTVLGWQAFVASVGFLNGTMTQGLIILTDLTYEPHPWHSVMLFWGVILFGVLVNTVISSWLPRFEALILILHILGFFAILLPLVILGPHAQSSQVFQNFINGGEWPNNGLSFFVGLLGNVFAFFGADGAIHMSEEIQNAAVVVPNAIVFSIILNGFLGFGMALSLLFCIGDIEAAFHTKTGYPFIEIFYQAVQDITGAALMTSIVVALSLCATVGIVASASRQLWAFSRDRAVPGWKQIQRVNSKSAIPILAVFLTTVLACVLALIVLGSSTAFNDIVSLSVVGLFGSYFIVAVLLLWRRLRGDIKLYPSSGDVLTNVPGKELTWGPWRIPGVLGIMTNSFAIVYLIIIFFFSLWPPMNHPTAATMNYSSLMFGGTMIFSVLYYFFRARYVYTGPVIQIDS